MPGVVPDETELGEGQAQEAAMPSAHHELPMRTNPAKPTPNAATVSGIMMP